ncbi:RNA-directed DNA polymerase, eukaryota, reverse transcriptase zinc-binding domain protein [Tanacetum coccineum]
MNNSDYEVAVPEGLPLAVSILDEEIDRNYRSAKFCEFHPVYSTMELQSKMAICRDMAGTTWDLVEANIRFKEVFGLRVNYNKSKLYRVGVSDSELRDMARALKGRLPVREELDKRGIDLDSILCPSCGDIVESCSHCLVMCNFAMSVWEKIFNWWKSFIKIVASGNLGVQIFYLERKKYASVQSLSLRLGWRERLAASRKDTRDFEQTHLDGKFFTKSKPKEAQGSDTRNATLAIRVHHIIDLWLSQWDPMIREEMNSQDRAARSVVLKTRSFSLAL